MIGDNSDSIEIKMVTVPLAELEAIIERRLDEKFDKWDKEVEMRRRQREIDALPDQLTVRQVSNLAKSKGLKYSIPYIYKLVNREEDPWEVVDGSNPLKFDKLYVLARLKAGR